MITRRLTVLLLLFATLASSCGVVANDVESVDPADVPFETDEWGAGSRLSRSVGGNTQLASAAPVQLVTASTDPGSILGAIQSDVVGAPLSAAGGSILDALAVTEPAPAPTETEPPVAETVEAVGGSLLDPATAFATGPRTDLTTGPTYTAVQVPADTPVYSQASRDATQLSLQFALDADIDFYWNSTTQQQHFVTARVGDFYEIDLPTRPNSLRGFVHVGDVTPVSITTAIFVDVDARQLRLEDNGAIVFTATAAVGRPSAPTPRTTTYISQLFAPTGTTALGPYAFSLAAFSDVLTDFGGGVGQSAIHGTNDPSSIGHDVSAGCVRLTNEDITELVQTVKLGTPVFIF